MVINLDLTRRAATQIISLSKQYILPGSIRSNQNEQQHRNNTEPARTDAQPGSIYNFKFSGFMLGRKGHDHESKSTHTNRQDDHPSSTEYLVHNWLEALFAWFQVVVLWHDPVLSVIAISTILAMFLMLTYFGPRLYATILIAVLAYKLTKFWFRHIWPEIRVTPSEDEEQAARLDDDRWTYLHPQLITLKEFRQYLSNLIKSSGFSLERFTVMRRQNPTKFYLIVCSILSCVAYVGNQISDAKLIISIVFIVMIAPGIYLHQFPQALKDQLEGFIRVHYPNLILTGRCEDLESELLEQSESKQATSSNETQQQETSAQTSTDLDESLSKSSSESASLIDLDEKIQDGFVLL